MYGTFPVIVKSTQFLCSELQTCHLATLVICVLLYLLLFFSWCSGLFGALKTVGGLQELDALLMYSLVISRLESSIQV